MSEQFKESTTQIGFKRVSFTDEYGIDCSLQEGSKAGKACIWLGVENAPDRMHLTQEHVRALLPYLNRFVETGKL